jgi:chromate transport protein ChrA
LGYVLLGVAGVIFAATANRWKRVFPGIMLAATLGALLELEQGHAVNNPSVLIPRWIALVQLAVIAVVAALSFTFKKRPLNIVDRIALLAFAASIFVGGDEATRQELPLALIVGGVCVLAAWAYDHVQRRPETSATT